MVQPHRSFLRAIFILTTQEHSKIASIFWDEQKDSERWVTLKIAQKQGAWVSRESHQGREKRQSIAFLSILSTGARVPIISLDPHVIWR